MEQLPNKQPLILKHSAPPNVEPVSELPEDASDEENEMIDSPQTLPENTNMSISQTLAQNESLSSASINSSPANARTEADDSTILIDLDSNSNSNTDCCNKRK